MDETPAAGPEFVAVAKVSELAEGEFRGVEVDGEPVVLARVDGRVYALGGVCTHQFALLADGELGDGFVLCPLHNSGFDLATGAATQPPAVEPVPVYEVRIAGDDVLVSRRPRPR